MWSGTLSLMLSLRSSSLVLVLACSRRTTGTTHRQREGGQYEMHVQACMVYGEERGGVPVGTLGGDADRLYTNTET